MESGSIQSLFGFIPDQKTENDLQFNLPLNYKKNLLFDKLPYVAKLDNPAIEDVVNGNNADDLPVQKFLLNFIQESLNMIVTDGNFNNASIRRTLDTKYPSIMKKPNPINFIFKNKDKFDIQNPVIGSLYEQITKNKKNELAKKLLSTTQEDTKSAFEKMADFSRKIRKDDDVVDVVDDDNVDTTATSSTTRSTSTPLVGDQSKFLPASSLNDTKIFLLDLNVDKNVKANESVVRSPTTEKVTFPDRITRLFPDAVEPEDNFKEIDNDSDNDSISEVKMTASELKDGNLSSHLQFFPGGKKMEKKLFESVAKNVGIISDSNQ